MAKSNKPEMRRREYRVFAVRELRVQKRDDGKTQISGYAAVFNSLSVDLGGFVEEIAPGAFTDCLKAAPDVRCLFNHEPNLILGRSTAGTLSLAEDDKGLRYECELPDTQYARDLAVSMERGDITQCSFGFFCLDDEWGTRDGAPLRTVTKAELFDVSPVTYPAYLDTEVAVRSLFPDGRVTPPEARSNAEGCDCDCDECRDDDCEECSNPDCDDPECLCQLRSRRARMRLAAVNL